MLSYGRLTIDFGIVVFAKTRWLFSYGVTFLPDARGKLYDLGSFTKVGGFGSRGTLAESLEVRLSTLPRDITFNENTKHMYDETGLILRQSLIAK